MTMRPTALIEAVENLTQTQVGVAQVSKALGTVKHVLIGGYALPIHTGIIRATMDVDMVVADVAQAEAAIAKNFPSLKKLKNPGEDVTKNNAVVTIPYAGRYVTETDQHRGFQVVLELSNGEKPKAFTASSILSIVAVDEK